MQNERRIRGPSAPTDSAFDTLVAPLRGEAEFKTGVVLRDLLLLHVHVVADHAAQNAAGDSTNDRSFYSPVTDHPTQDRTGSCSTRGVAVRVLMGLLVRLRSDRPTTASR